MDTDTQRQEARVRIAAALAAGGTLDEAAQAGGISVRTVKRWRAGDRQFDGECRQAISAARAAGKAGCDPRAMQNAVRVADAAIVVSELKELQRAGRTFAQCRGGYTGLPADHPVRQFLAAGPPYPDTDGGTLTVEHPGLRTVEMKLKRPPTWEDLETWAAEAGYE